MDKIFEKKMEILNGVYKSEHGLSWNELTQLLNELIELCKEQKWEVSQVKCDMCGNEWTAVRPLGTEKLECNKCGNVTIFEII